MIPVPATYQAQPTFKGVWHAAVNFAPLLFLDTCSGPTTRTRRPTNKVKTGPDYRAINGTSGPHSRPTDPHSWSTAHKQPLGPTLAANAPTSWSIARVSRPSLASL